jgi:hypothetical protein
LAIAAGGRIPESIPECDCNHRFEENLCQGAGKVLSMDPLSIATGSIAITRFTSQISLALYNYIIYTKNVDQTVRSFRGEVDGLTRLLDSIGTAVSNPIIKSAVATTPENFELLGPITEELISCRGCVEALAGVLERVAQGSNIKNFFRRSVRAMKLNLSSDDIARFRSEIHVHSTQLQIALQIINL